MIAVRLQWGDEVRIVSPAVSLGFIPEDQQLTARERLEGLGLRCSFSTNAEVMDRFDSSPVEARVSDLHDAFVDPGVKGILTTLGGYNSNGLLGYLDYDLIRANPKIFCGFSDITALATAIHARTGLVTYSGPHFTTFGMKRGIDYTKEYFERCLMRGEPFEVLPALITGAMTSGTRTRRSVTSYPTPATRSCTKARRRANCSGEPENPVPALRHPVYAEPGGVHPSPRG
jgi:muramoyltetrapeptide carboxypeptidase LdcA involved in peptidoglycan recycling